MIHYFIVPGLGNSGPDHWQSYFEQSGPGFIRINQQEWDAPDCQEWVSEIEKTVSSYKPESVVLIGHSLGCCTIAHWAEKYNKQIKGALLVAPSDLEAPQYTFPTKGFSPIPKQKLNFPSIVIASTNDPWVTLDRAQYFAENWGSRFVSIGEAGHINVASGFGPWPEGLEILSRLGKQNNK